MLSTDIKCEPDTQQGNICKDKSQQEQIHGRSNDYGKRSAKADQKELVYWLLLAY